MKKILKYGLIMMLITLTITGCSSKNKNLNMSAEEVIKEIYTGISADDMPKVFNTNLDKDNVTSYLGTDKVDFKEAVASEPMMGSIAYSVVAIKLNSGANIETTKKLIKESVNPAKWLCVDAEIVTVDNNGDMILLIMMDEENEELAKKVQNNFKNLK